MTCNEQVNPNLLIDKEISQGSEEETTYKLVANGEDVWNVEKIIQVKKNKVQIKWEDSWISNSALKRMKTQINAVKLKEKKNGNLVQWKNTWESIDSMKYNLVFIEYMKQKKKSKPKMQKKNVRKKKLDHQYQNKVQNKSDEKKVMFQLEETKQVKQTKRNSKKVYVGTTTIAVVMNSPSM